MTKATPPGNGSFLAEPIIVLHIGIVVRLASFLSFLSCRFHLSLWVIPAIITR
jgi:hypothetical protein